MNETYLISVVIPTKNRPTLVLRAIMSALNQTYKKIEVIVVIDGPDESTVKIIEQISDPKVRVLALSENVGGSDARNAGVRAANGEWVAFLDDDDEWFPEKLTKQIESSSHLHNTVQVISCYIIARTPRGDFVFPRRGPRPNEPISEYLFVRRSFFHGETLFLTSMLLAKKKLLERVPFSSGLRRYQDADWLLRVGQLDDFCFYMVPEPLAIVYSEEQRNTVCSQNMWEYSLEWLRQNRNLFTPRAYAGFVATQLSSQASGQGQYKAFVPLILEMFRFGSPRIFDGVIYVLLWSIPQNLRRRFRAIFK